MHCRAARWMRRPGATSSHNGFRHRANLSSAVGRWSGRSCTRRRAACAQASPRAGVCRGWYQHGRRSRGPVCCSSLARNREGAKRVEGCVRTPRACVLLRVVLARVPNVADQAFTNQAALEDVVTAGQGAVETWFRSENGIEFLERAMSSMSSPTASTQYIYL